MAYPQIQPPQSVAAQPTLTSVAAPSLTASTTFVCLGLAAPITPLASGRVKVDIDAVALSSVIGDGVTAQVIYGTGSAPANGAAVPGSAVTVGQARAFVGSTAAGQQGLGFSALITNLTPGTAYWVDLQFKAVTGGNATISNVDVVLTEV